jgi:hypothetical protein
MMFRLAGGIMANQGFDFLFSGEVLGQRPMSQNLSALQAVAKHSDQADRILRPLSARLLPETRMEASGLVDRQQLLDIQGRTRRRQEALAKEWGLSDYPASGGGCLLTEKHFSDRLRDLVTHEPACTTRDVELLKTGRQFRLSPRARLAVGRNQQDNEALRELAGSRDLLLRCIGFGGPLGVLSGDPAESDVETAAALVAGYGKGSGEALVEVLVVGEGVERTVKVVPLPLEKSRGWLL